MPTGIQFISYLYIYVFYCFSFEMEASIENTTKTQPLLLFLSLHFDR